MNRPTTRTTLAMTLAMATIAGIAAADSLEETIDRTLSFAAGSRLEVANSNGSIQVAVWDRNEVHVQAEKRVRSRGDQDVRDLIQELRVIIEETADGVRIETEHPRRDGGWWGRGVSSSVDYRIRLPRDSDLNLETVNGKVRVDGVHGDLTLGSTNGGITVNDSGGRVDAHTTNGSIDVELQQVVDGEDMSFRSTNGGITLALPGDARASVEARTTNGGIHTDFPVTVQGSFNKKRLEGEINGGGGRIELRTTNGGIKIREL